MSDSALSFASSLSGDSQRRAAKRLRVYAKRVPSYLTPDRQREAVRDVRAGQAMHHVAQNFGVAESVIQELYSRDIERRTRDLMAGLSARLDELDADLRGRPTARKDAGAETTRRATAKGAAA